MNEKPIVEKIIADQSAMIKELYEALEHCGEWLEDLEALAVLEKAKEFL